MSSAENRVSIEPRNRWERALARTVPPMERFRDDTSPIPEIFLGIAVVIASAALVAGEAVSDGVSFLIQSRGSRR